MIKYRFLLLIAFVNCLAVSCSGVGDVLTQLQSGSDISTQTSPLTSPGTRQSAISFDRSYDSTPIVLIYIASISAQKSAYQDYKIFSSDVSTDGFTINYQTTKPGNTLKFAVNWIAFEQNDNLAEVIYTDITITTNLQDTSLGATQHADLKTLTFANTYSTTPNVSLFLLGITSLYLSSDTIDFSSTSSTTTATTIGMTIWNSSLVSAVSFIALICKSTVCSSSAGSHTNRSGTSIISTDVWQNTSASSRTVQDTQTISTVLSQPSVSSASTKTFSGITGYDIRLNYLLNLEITSAVFSFPTATQQAKTWGTSTVVTGFWNSVNCYSTPKSISDLNFHLTWWQIILIVIASIALIAIIVYSYRRYQRSRNVKSLLKQEELRQQQLQSQLAIQKQKDSIIMKLNGQTQGDATNNQYSQGRSNSNIKRRVASPSNNLISELTGQNDETQKSNLLRTTNQKVTPIQTNRLVKQQQQAFSPNNQQQSPNSQMNKLVCEDSIEYSYSHNNNYNNNNYDMNTSIQQPQLDVSGNFQNNPNDSKLPFANNSNNNNPFVDTSDDYYNQQQPQQSQQYNKTIQSINNNRNNPQLNTINSRQSYMKQMNNNNNSITNDSVPGNNFANNKQRFSNNNAEYSFGIANNPNNSLSFQPNRLNSNTINDSQSLNSNRIEDQSYSQRQQQQQDIPRDQVPKQSENYAEEIIEDSQEYDYRQSPNKSNKFNTPSNRFTSPTNLHLFTSPNNNNSNNFTSPTNLFTGSSHPRLIDPSQDSENKESNAPFDFGNTSNNNSSNNYSRFHQQDDGITSGNFGGAGFNPNKNNTSGLREGQFNQFPIGSGVNNLHIYNRNTGQERSRFGQIGSYVLQSKGRSSSPDQKRMP